MAKWVRNLRGLWYSAALGCVLLWAHGLAAQSFYGSIVGTVTDQSGAIVPGATVTLTNAGTGERTIRQSNSSGIYEFLELIPAAYSMDFEKQGFKHLTRTQIQVRVNSTVRADVSLAVGQVTENVQVTSETPLLQTESAELSQVIEGRQVQDTPLNGRNIFNLVALAAGVVPLGSTMGAPMAAGGTTIAPAGFNNYSIGGGVVAENAIFVDGAQNDLSGNNTPLVPTQDSIQEFSVLTNNISAEFGGYDGGVISLTTKSGTNQLHGTAYEYIRNRDFNANDFFNKRNGLARPEFTQNQYGGTLGGPVIRKKAFFFASYEGYSLRKGIPTTYTMPTAAELSGNFAGLNTIYDPLTTCGQLGNPACSPAQLAGTAPLRTPFPNNQIPNGTVGGASRFDPTALIMMQKYFVLPNKSGNVNNYVLNFPNGGDSPQATGRIDYSLNDQQRAFVRYAHWEMYNEVADPFGNLTGSDNYDFNTNQTELGYTYTIRPTLILDLRASYLRETYPKFSESVGINQSIFGPAWAPIGQQLPYTLYPAESISGGFFPLSPVGQGNKNDDYFYSGSLTKVLGRHTIKGGAYFKRDFVFAQINGANAFSYDATFTSANATNSSTSGSGFADFILGSPTTGSLGTLRRVYPYLNAYAFYVQDDFQVTPRLTLNLGLRWDQPGADGEAKNSDVVLNLTAKDPIGAAAGLPNLSGQGELVASTAYPSRLQQALHWTGFGPRAGLSWRLNNATVVRGGFGINYLPYLTYKYPAVSAAINSAVTSMVTTLNGGQTQNATMSNPFPNGLLQAAGPNPAFLATLEGGNLLGTLPNSHLKYAMQFNLTVERELGHTATIQVTYAGNLGRHLAYGGGAVGLDQLPDQYDICGTDSTQPQCNGQLLSTKVANPFYNVLPSSVGVLGQATVAQGYLLRPYPQFLSLQTYLVNSGVSSYNALQVSFQKRFTSGGTIMANYTFSKFLSDTESQTGSQESDIAFSTPQDWYNRHAEYSLAASDVPQRMTVSYIYDLPFGKGKMFLGQLKTVPNAFIGGWTVGGVTTISNGFPLNIKGLANNLASQYGSGNIRPNVVAGCTKKMPGSGVARISEWFNTACFTQPGAYSFGNETRTDASLRSAGPFNFDFSLSKNIPIHEKWSMEFDTQFFNLFNRVQFAAPNVSEGNGSFGIVSATSPSSTPREVQFALRLKF